MKDVQKITLKRIYRTEEITEFEHMILILELCKESDDYLWKELILNHMEMLKILNSSEGKRIKKEIRRKLNHGN